MIHSDNDYVTETREGIAVIARQIRGTSGEPAAVKRDHDRPLAAILEAGRPYVQDKAVFAHPAGFLVPFDRSDILAARIGKRLWRDLSVGEGIAHAGPWSGFLRRHVAVSAGSRSAVGNSVKCFDAVDVEALDFAGGRLRDGEHPFRSDLAKYRFRG